MIKKAIYSQVWETIGAKYRYKTYLFIIIVLHETRYYPQIH